MDSALLILWTFLSTALMATAIPSPGSDLYDVDVHKLAAGWEKERTSPANPYALKHSELRRRLHAIAREFSDTVHLQTIGASVEGREICLVSLGNGPTRILLWSQMHGDEPTATSALLDLYRFFGMHRSEKWVGEILNRFTLLSIPMLNPDGAERNQRRNSQGIDINRDARRLQTPEGRLLKDVVDRYRPILAFNLHNQNAQTTVGNTGKVATMALLAVAADVAPESADPRKEQVPSLRGSDLSKRVTAVLYEALSPFIYGHISRYDETYNPRAFGDNITLWGSPVVLIESGGLPAGAPLDLTVKLNFVGLLAVFNSLATGKIEKANPAVFDSMRLNSDAPIFDLLLRDAWIYSGERIPPFRGDIAIRKDARAGSGGDAIIADIGDLGVFTAHEAVDCSGTLVTPGLVAWDPKKSLFEEAGPGRDYLSRGFLTVIETARWSDLARNDPSESRWRSAGRITHWGFLVAGGPDPKEKQPEFTLGGWFAAGGRAWVVDGLDRIREELPRAAKMVEWFGAELMPASEAEAVKIPEKLQGETLPTLSRWTSESARRLRLPRRGQIVVGAPADLVIWSLPSGQIPSDLGQMRPRQVVLSGALLDPSKEEVQVRGKFLAR